MWITYSAGGFSDTTAPAVAITAPAAGATITCADTSVTGTASDASGNQSVEVQIDGGAWSPATYTAGTGTFQLTWASSVATSGTHTIAARATDASCNHNVATTAARSATVNDASCGVSLDVSGWKLQQQNSTQTFTLPAGTTIASKGYLIVARDATKAAFETFWRGGTPLPSNVTYVSSAGVMPQINGSENYTLSNASATVIDGPTISMPASANSTVQRKDPCLAAGTASSWTTTTITGTITGPTPGQRRRHRLQQGRGDQRVLRCPRHQQLHL